MSLFDDIANEIGHTVDSLAQEVGRDVSTLEGLVNEFGSYGIDVLQAAAKLGLSPVGFLRGIVDIMSGDPHQRLLQHFVGPVQPLSEPAQGLSSQWTQMGQLHQDTAQQIDRHMTELFQGSTTDSYKSPAAEALLSKHQDYQQYFTTLVDHAQTQQERHATLASHVDDYLGQAPSKVYSLSAPLAALGVLALDTATVDSPPGVQDSSVVQEAEQFLQKLQENWAAQLAEQTIQNLEQTEEGLPDPPENPIAYGIAVLILAVAIILAVIIIIAAIVYILVTAWNGIADFIAGAWNSFADYVNSKLPFGWHLLQPVSPNTPPQQVQGAQNNPTASMADDLSQQYGVPLSVVEDIINKNPGLTKDQYALLVQYYKKYGKYPFNTRAVFIASKPNGKDQIYYITQGDLDHIREHPDDLQELSDEELLAKTEDLLQNEKPDKVVTNKNKGFVDYNYNDVDIDGHYITVDVRVSTTNPGRIISVFERTNG